MNLSAFSKALPLVGVTPPEFCALFTAAMRAVIAHGRTVQSIEYSVQAEPESGGLQALACFCIEATLDELVALDRTFAGLIDPQLAFGPGLLLVSFRNA